MMLFIILMLHQKTALHFGRVTLDEASLSMNRELLDLCKKPIDLTMQDSLHHYKEIIERLPDAQRIVGAVYAHAFLENIKKKFRGFDHDYSKS